MDLDVIGDRKEHRGPKLDWLTTQGKTRLSSYGFCVAKSRVFKGKARVTLQSSQHIGYFVVRQKRKRKSVKVECCPSYVSAQWDFYVWSAFPPPPFPR